MSQLGKKETDGKIQKQTVGPSSWTLMVNGVDLYNTFVPSLKVTDPFTQSRFHAGPKLPPEAHFGHFGTRPKEEIKPAIFGLGADWPTTAPRPPQGHCTSPLQSNCYVQKWSVILSYRSTKPCYWMNQQPSASESLTLRATTNTCVNVRVDP